MKNLVFTALFLIFLISCQKEGIDNKQNAIKVTAQKSYNDMLKTVFLDATVKWIAGVDQIGIYSDRAYPTTPASPASNVAYTAQATNFSSTFSSVTTIYFDGTTNIHTFYGYYPYVSGSVPVTAVPISLPAAQAQVGTSTTHIGALDFEVAKPLQLIPVPGGENPVVSFSFNHLFAILKFDLTCPADNNLTSISVTTSAAPAISLNNGSTIDISQTEPAAGVPYNISVAPGGTPLNVTLYANLHITSTIASAYMLILPGNSSANTFTINYNSSTGKTFTVSRLGTNFERGKIYTITQDIPTGPGGW